MMETPSNNPCGPIDHVEGSKNIAAVSCRLCSSVILNANTAEFVKRELVLPHTHKKNDEPVGDGEKLENFWLVPDILYLRISASQRLLVRSNTSSVQTAKSVPLAGTMSLTKRPFTLPVIV